MLSVRTGLAQSVHQVQREWKSRGQWDIKGNLIRGFFIKYILSVFSLYLSWLSTPQTTINIFKGVELQSPVGGILLSENLVFSWEHHSEIITSHLAVSAPNNVIYIINTVVSFFLNNILVL